MQQARTERSIADLFTDLTRETSQLVRQEVALAKAEVTENFSRARAGAVALAIGAVLGLGGFLVILDAIVFVVAMALGPEVAPWVSAFIVGGVVMVLALIFIQRGLKRLEAPLMPRRTVDSLKRNSEFAKEQVR
jgi:MFS family permease